MSKPTTPLSRKLHGQLGDLERAGGVAHRGQQADDPDRAASQPCR
jgi:hypothetical protein